MEICKYNKGIKYLLCAIDLFNKYAWAVTIKAKTCVSIVAAFQKILKESNQKPNKIWVDKGSEFYNNYFKKWLKDNNIEMYLIHNKGKSVITKRFNRTLKNKISKHMTAISRNVYFDVLDIVNKYNNTVHRTIKMKPVDFKIINMLIQWNCIQRKKLMIKIQYLKWAIASEFPSIKIFFPKDTHQTGLKKILLLIKLKI